ncbi:hypothetical protein QQ045_015855 [Rhodiola kirilowii]
MAVIHRSRSASIRSTNASFNRFLKPGALARLRDSRISTAKSHNKSDANWQISACRVPPPTSASPEEIRGLQIDESFVFTMRTFGPRFLQRKKFGARRSSAVAPLSPAAAMSESAMDPLAGEIAAH